MRDWTRPLTLLALAGFLAFCGVSATGEQVPADKPKVDKPSPEPPKAATHKVEKGPFKVEVTLKGVFEAEHMTEIAIHPEAWTPQTGGILMLRKAIEHGTAVKKGDPILWLDTERIDQVIRDLEHDRQMAELTIKQAEDELPILEKAAPHDMAAAERAKRIADEDLKRYVEVDRAFTEKSIHQMLKSYTQHVEYVREELKQLQKMYKAKDLTEETEEIILRRQRNQLESAEFYLKMAQKEHEEALKIDLPRKDQALHESAARTTLLLEKARASIPTLLSQKRLALARLKYDREKSQDRLDKLKRDRELLTVKAPADGIVYHGKCVRGQWQSGLGDRLRPGGMVQADEALLTVVQAKPVFVRAEVEEKDLQYLQIGLKARVSPTLAPDTRLAAKLDKLVLVPVSAGKFDARLTVDMGKEASRVMPGMACSVKLVPYLREQAISVPASAVITDELDDDKQYVHLPSKDGKPTKKTVVIGKKVDRKVEILEGLKEGDEILLDKPGDGKKADIPSKEVKP